MGRNWVRMKRSLADFTALATIHYYTITKTKSVKAIFHTTCDN